MPGLSSLEELNDQFYTAEWAVSCVADLKASKKRRVFIKMAEPWACDVCTYKHESESERLFMACKICLEPRAKLSTHPNAAHPKALEAATAFGGAHTVPVQQRQAQHSHAAQSQPVGAPTISRFGNRSVEAGLIPQNLPASTSISMFDKEKASSDVGMSKFAVDNLRNPSVRTSSSTPTATTSTSRSTQNPLPEGWEQSIDPKSGRIFYINHKKRETTWHKPVEKSVKSPSVSKAKTNVESKGTYGASPDRIVAWVKKLLNDVKPVPSWMALKHSILSEFPDCEMDSVKARCQLLLRAQSESEEREAKRIESSTSQSNSHAVKEPSLAVVAPNPHDSTTATSTSSPTHKNSMKEASAIRSAQNATEIVSNVSPSLTAISQQIAQHQIIGARVLESGCWIEPAVKRALSGRDGSSHRKSSGKPKTQWVMEAGCRIQVEIDS